MTIDALLERFTFENVLEIHDASLFTFTLNAHLPGRRNEPSGIFQRVILVDTELVKVVVARDVVPRVDLFVLDAERTLDDVSQLPPVGSTVRCHDRPAGRQACSAGTGRHR